MSLYPWEGWCHLDAECKIKYNENAKHFDSLGSEKFFLAKRHLQGNKTEPHTVFLSLFPPLCMFFLSCSGLGECGLVALVSPLPPSSVCLMLSDWREGLGDGSVLLPVGLGEMRTLTLNECVKFSKV